MSQNTNFYLILASASPRRQELLQILGCPFIIARPAPPYRLNGADPTALTFPEVDETPQPGEAPVALVQRLSRLKAEAVAHHLSSLSLPPGAYPIILAADTIVVLNEQILGKPADPAEAAAMLQILRHRDHQVYTGFTLAVPPATAISLGLARGTAGTLFITRLHESIVWMRAYSQAELESYVAGGSPLDKAGAYGIQDKSFNPVVRLDGCFASVMGLPVGEVAHALKELGLNLPAVGPRCAAFTGRPCCQQ